MLIISLPYNMAARTAGIDRNKEIISVSTYVYVFARVCSVVV